MLAVLAGAPMVAYALWRCGGGKASASVEALLIVSFGFVALWSGLFGLISVGSRRAPVVAALGIALFLCGFAVYLVD